MPIYLKPTDYRHRLKPSCTRSESLPSPKWIQDWSEQCCIIVASGPSASAADLKAYKGRAKFIAVNESYRLAPWADALVCADGNWWHKKKGLPEFTGLKI